MLQDLEMENFLNGIALDVQNELKLSCPVDTGRLKNSIKARLNSKGEIIIYMVDYALDVEFGTKPHKIRPKTKKALHWKDSGKDVFATEVNHPGTKAQPFIRNIFYHKLNGIIKHNAELHLPEEIADQVEVSVG